MGAKKKKTPTARHARRHPSPKGNSDGLRQKTKQHGANGQAPGRAHRLFPGYSIAAEVLGLVLNVLFVWEQSHVAALWVAWFLICCIVAETTRGRLRKSVMAVVTIATVLGTIVVPPTVKQSETHGWLLPGNSPLPFEPNCGATKPTGLGVFFGNDFVAYSPPEKEYHVIIQADDVPLLAVKQRDGKLAVSARLYDNSGLMAQIEDNEFYVSKSGNVFRLDSSKLPHELSVFDKMGDLAMKVEFLNPKALRIRGRFTYPGKRVAVIDDKGLHFADPAGHFLSPGMYGEGSCVAHSMIVYL